MPMDNKAQTKEYFDRVAFNYLDRYYTADRTHYPNLQLRADIVMQAIGNYVMAGGRVLDAGCGGGNMVVELVRRGYVVSGLDIASGMVEATRALTSVLPAEASARAEVRQGDVESLPFPNASFDAVVASGVFEYLTADALALKEMRRVLKPGGIALISFRNRAFSVFSANAYTLNELDAGALKSLLSSVRRDIQADAPRIASRARDFYEDLQKVIVQLTEKPPAVVGSKQLLAYTENREATFWEKKMERRQHTIGDVESGANESGFKLEQVFFFHFHPLPPMLRDLMPKVYDALALALESFGDTRLGELLASGFVTILRTV